MKESVKIDFVVLWVDGSDPKWLAKKALHERKNAETSLLSSFLYGDANSSCRYRDDGTLRYWFRAVEKFAPWVNRVFLITDSQKPEWLNTSCPKLRFVDHKDFIPAQYLPTFNTRPIELNIHRIEDLSEHYVFFNDDMYLLQPVSRDFYFKKGLPRLPCHLGLPYHLGFNTVGRVMYNDFSVLNTTFDTSKQVLKNYRKWFNIPALGLRRVLKNLLAFAANRNIPIHMFGHLPAPSLKSTLGNIWETIPDIMEETSLQKFRSPTQVNQWLVTAWNLTMGTFSPVQEHNRGTMISLSTNTIDDICRTIQFQTFPQACFNDNGQNDDPELCRKRLVEAFQKLLPEKSSFEK